MNKKRDGTAFGQISSPRPAGGSGGGSSDGGVTIHTGGFVIQPSLGLDETALAGKVAKTVDRTIKDAFAGEQSNGGTGWRDYADPFPNALNGHWLH
jgi:hypothetical protein